MDATTTTFKTLSEAADRVRSAIESDLPLEELTWLLPVGFLPDATALFDIPVRRAAGIDRPYLAHTAGEPVEAAPLGDPTSPDTAYAAVAQQMERWIEENYDADFFPDGRRGSRAVVQALLDLGWRPPPEVADSDITLHIQDTGGPGNGIVATVDGGEQFFPLPGRRQQITLAQIRDGLR